MDKSLERFAMIWGCLVFILNVAAIVGLFIGAGSFWAGWWRVTEIYSPFNVINWIAELVLISPAIGALYWLQRRQARAKR
jgi:hypothetical protein